MTHNILQSIYDLVRQDRIDDALDILFSTVDALLSASDLDPLVNLLKNVDLGRLGLTVQLALLSATIPVTNLPARIDLASRIEALVRQADPGRADRLLVGLIPVGK